MGLLHGGIRPGNILLTQDGAVKLCDFSLGEDVVYGEMSQCNVAYAAVSAPVLLSVYLCNL